MAPSCFVVPVTGRELSSCDPDLHNSLNLMSRREDQCERDKYMTRSKRSPSLLSREVQMENEGR